MSVSGLENSNLQVKKPELIKFEVSKKQLIGEPWPSSQGGRFQNILFADGWMLTRPVERLHETEDGKIAFWLAKYKKDGTENKITLRRSRRLEETDENDKPVYKNEEMQVKIEELKDIEKYGKEKYRFQKEAEKTKQISKNNPEYLGGIENRVSADESFPVKEAVTRLKLEANMEHGNHGEKFYGMITFVASSEKEEDNIYNFYDDEALFNREVAYQKRRGTDNYGTVLTREQFIENIANALETNGHYTAIGADLCGDYTVEVAEWRDKHPASVAVEPELEEINKKVSAVHAWEIEHLLDVKDDYATRIDGHTGQIFILSDQLLDIRYRQIVNEQSKERFEAVETEDINEPFSVIDNETGTLLQKEENLPYRFYTKASADAFAKDANELAQDGLLIRCHKDKAYAFCKIAVSQNALALYFIPNQTMELALDAVYQNPAAIVAVKDTYKDEIVKKMPEMIFNKMQRGEVAQNEVIHHLLSLDSRSNYSVFIVTEDGKRHEIKAENISSSITKLTNDTHSYTALSGENRIRFNDKNIEEVQYRGTVAAFYDVADRESPIAAMDDREVTHCAEVETAKDEERWNDFVSSHATLLQGKESDRKTLVINAFGGAGAGKTTACLEICQKLKKAGYVAEYVQEYAKDLVWEENWEQLDGTQTHQFEILQEQLRRMDRLHGKVDFIVTDAPIILNAVYNKELTAAYEKMLFDLYGQYNSFNFVVKRDASKFEQEGRMQNLEESIEKDNSIKEILDKNKVYYGTYNHSTVDKIVDNAINTLFRIELDEQNEKDYQMHEARIRPRSRGL